MQSEVTSNSASTITRATSRPEDVFEQILDLLRGPTDERRLVIMHDSDYQIRRDCQADCKTDVQPILY